MTALTTDPLRTVYDALEHHGCDPRGPEYKHAARCPAHEDRSPSLSVAEGSDGRALVYCFSGCETRDIIAAIGLTWSDLFPPGHRHAPRSPILARPSVTREPVDLVLEALRELGIAYRCTRRPDMWVVERCASCEIAHPTVPWPLWIVREDERGPRAGHRVRLICGHGCAQEAVLAALLGVGAEVTS
jgi:hypothetical protein